LAAGDVGGHQLLLESKYGETGRGGHQRGVTDDLVREREIALRDPALAGGGDDAEDNLRHHAGGGGGHGDLVQGGRVEPDRLVDGTGGEDREGARGGENGRGGECGPAVPFVISARVPAAAVLVHV